MLFIVAWLWQTAGGPGGCWAHEGDASSKPGPATHLLGLPHLDHRHASNDRVGVLQAQRCRPGLRQPGQKRQRLQAMVAGAGVLSQPAGCCRRTRGPPPHHPPPTHTAHDSHPQSHTLAACPATGRQTDRPAQLTSRAAELMVSLAPMTTAMSKLSISGFTCSSRRNRGSLRAVKRSRPANSRFRPGLHQA